VRRAVIAFGLVLAAVRLGADDIDDYVNAQKERQRIPGLSVAICRAGRLARAAGYGLANVELAAPATPETVYQSGSLGKQFAATAVMMLVEEGRLRLDDPITRFFPGAPDWWKGATVRNLLTHTSGIPDWGEKEIDYRRDYTEEELAKVAMSLPPDFAPGTQWSYSNTGYVLLGIIVRTASGKFYGDLLEERVFGPLGMTATRVISEADIVKNRAAGYRLEKDALKNQEWVSPTLNTTADGSLYLTALDLARWDAALYGDALLPRARLQQMWTPVRLANGATFPYGFGWSVEEQRGSPNIEHGGSWQGFRTHIARYLDQKLTVIVLANLAEARPEVIAHGIAGLVEPSLRRPGPRDARPDPDEERTRSLKAVLDAWGSGRPSPRMAAGLRAASSGTPREKSSRERTAERCGKMTALTYLDEDEVDGRGLDRRGEKVARILYYGLLTADAAYTYRFHLNAAGEVVDFSSEEP
jgi:CubicO group peptidase (beta-lactamase class C family)